MSNLTIPVWLLAVAFVTLVSLNLYSIQTGEPIYIHGEPWGVNRTPIIDGHVTNSNLKYENEVTCNSQCKVSLGSSSNRICFLTYFRHDPIGWGEYAHVLIENNNWYLVTETGAPRIQARARCAIIENL